MIFVALALLFVALFLMDGLYLRRRRGRQVKRIRATVPDYPGRFGLDVRIR